MWQNTSKLTKKQNSAVVTHTLKSCSEGPEDILRKKKIEPQKNDQRMILFLILLSIYLIPSISSQRIHTINNFHSSQLKKKTNPMLNL